MSSQRNTIGNVKLISDALKSDITYSVTTARTILNTQLNLV